MSKRSRRGVGLAALWLAAGVAFAADPSGVGVLKLVRGDVQLMRGEQAQPAAVGMSVQVNDRLSTGADGFVGITFEDNSLFSLGASGHIRIDRYEYNSTTHEGAFDTTLSAGRLAVVGGKIARQTPDAMRLRTPYALLGVRDQAEFVVEARVRQP